MRNLSAFQPNTETLLNSLGSYWKLDESSGDAADVMGANTLTNSNVTYAASKINNGAVFNGTTAIFRKLNILQYTGNFSISGWVKPTDATAADVQTIVVNELTGTAGGPYRISIQTNGKLRFSVYATGTGTETFVDSATTLSDNTFVFFTCVRDGTNIIIYLNGAYDNQTAWSTAQNTNASTYFQLGATQDSGTTKYRLLAGQIDEVGVWNRALTANEISILYGNGNGRQVNILPNSTKAYYPLNGNSTDYSGNGNHGTETAITYTQGMFGQGARFNGTSSKIQQTTTAGTFGGSTITVSFWVNYMSTTPADLTFLIAKYNDSSDFGSWVCWYRTSGTKIQFGTNSDKTSNTMTLIDYIPKINSKWQHYTLVNNGSNALIYVDGLLVASGSREDMDSTSQPLTIGASNSGRYFTGMIDEVIIESRAWTAAEVSTYYRKSMLNYGKKSFAQIVYTYTSELLKGSYTLTGKNLNTLYNRVASLLKGAYTLTGKQLTANKAYVAQLLKGTYNLVGKILTTPNRWRNQTKNTSAWTEQSKNSSTWTNRNKS